jgi:hypothetical protein
VNTLTKTASLLSAYPNPASNFITISGITAKGSLKLISSDGKVLQTKNIGSDNTTIDVTKLNKGIYIILFEGINGERSNTRFVKE